MHRLPGASPAALRQTDRLEGVSEPSAFGPASDAGPAPGAGSAVPPGTVPSDEEAHRVTSSATPASGCSLPPS